MQEDLLKVMLLDPGATVPEKAHFGDAGFDLFAPRNIIINPYSFQKIGLGIAVEFMGHYMGLIQEKSGKASIHGTFTIGNIIDSGYRGEIHVIIANPWPKAVWIAKGQKIAQLVLIHCFTGTGVKVVDELSSSGRGVGGFGSTGDFKSKA